MSLVKNARSFLLAAHSCFSIRHRIQYRTPTVRFRTLLRIPILLKAATNKAYSIGITVGKFIWQISEMCKDRTAKI